MQTTIEKQALIDWIINLNDDATLQEIASLKQKASFNFDKAWEKGKSIDEAREQSKKITKSLPWKKPA